MYATTLSATFYQNLPTQALSGLSDTQITSPALSSVLKWNGSKWVPATDQTGGGGGGSPGGNSGDIQFNDGGAFGGTAQLNWNSTSNLLSGTNARFTNLSATTLSATTYQNLPTSALSGLSDTQIGTPTNGQVLKWDSTLSKWTPQTDNTGGGGGGGSDTTVITTVTGTATLASTVQTVLVSALSNITVTMPTPVGNSGKMIYFKNLTDNDVTFTTPAGLIDDDVNLIVQFKNSSFRLISDNVDWNIF